MIVVAELDKFLFTKEPYWDKLDSYLEPISYVFQRRKVKKTDLSMFESRWGLQFFCIIVIEKNEK